jgi:hypothetical protein
MLYYITGVGKVLVLVHTGLLLIETLHTDLLLIETLQAIEMLVEAGVVLAVVHVVHLLLTIRGMSMYYTCKEFKHV